LPAATPLRFFYSSKADLRRSAQASGLNCPYTLNNYGCLDKFSLLSVFALLLLSQLVRIEISSPGSPKNDDR
jgi:hypothetical protein